MDNLQSNYKFISSIHHYIFIVLLCIVLIELTLVYFVACFVKTDKIIDNLYIYFTGQSVQVTINDRVVDRVFDWNICKAFMKIGMYSLCLCNFFIMCYNWLFGNYFTLH